MSDVTPHHRSNREGTPLIVVIVPVYNRARTVLPTLNTVASQTLPPSALYIVDDGSTDGLNEAVQAWQGEVQPSFKVHYLRQERLGVSTARNRGIDATPDADYYAFLDSDDLWPEDFLERTCDRLEQNPDAVAASADRLQDDFIKREQRLARLDVLEHGATEWLIAHGTGIGSATLFRASCIRERGGFDVNTLTGEDTQLFLPLSVQGPWLHAPGQPVVYGIGKAQVNGEHDHLCQDYDNYWETWTNILENFIERGGGRAKLSDAFCDRHLALRWYRSGKQASRAGDYQLAKKHFRRALKYRNSMKTRMQLLKAIFRSWNFSTSKRPRQASSSNQ